MLCLTKRGTYCIIFFSTNFTLLLMMETLKSLVPPDRNIANCILFYTYIHIFKNNYYLWWSWGHIIAKLNHCGFELFLVQETCGLPTDPDLKWWCASSLKHIATAAAPQRFIWHLPFNAPSTHQSHYSMSSL